MFALQLQQAHAVESDLPGVRIGVHLGEVTERLGPSGAVQVEGLAVDVAARVQGLAKPGQVLMSSSVYNSAKQRMGVDTMGQPILWQLHGLYDLKGMDHPLEIGEAGLEGMSPLLAPEAGEKARPVGSASSRARRRDFILSWVPTRQSILPVLLGLGLLILTMTVIYLLVSRLPDAPTRGDETIGADDAIGPITSLAVLPLDSLSDDPEQDYFADGMTEAIITELAKIKALKVISRTSVMQYKDTTKTMPEIAAELGVDGLIEGSVLRDGNDVRITVQLIHGPSDAHLWSESYTETITSVLKLQSDVALAIADALQAELTGEERTRIAQFRSIDSSAQEAYLLGQHFLNETAEDGINDAIRYFEEATRIEPEFAEAWAQLASAHVSAVTWGYATGAEAYPKARAAARRALDIDSDLALAHGCLGNVSMAQDREWQEAEERYKRALELSPSSAEAHASYGWFLRWVGRMDEALQHIQTAFELDHEDPWIKRGFGEFLELTGEPSRAELVLKELLAQRPDFIPAIESLLETYVALGQYDQAIEAAKRWVEVADGDLTSQYRIAYTLALTGRTTRAKTLVDGFAAQSNIVDHAFLGFVYAVLGEYDTAFEFLEKGYENRDWWTVMIRTEPYRRIHSDNPSMTKFRKDSRFWSLVERMGFPPLPPEHPGYADEQAWLARKATAEGANAPI